MLKNKLIKLTIALKKVIGCKNVIVNKKSNKKLKKLTCQLFILFLIIILFSCMNIDENQKDKTIKEDHNKTENKATDIIKSPETNESPQEEASNELVVEQKDKQFSKEQDTSKKQIYPMELETELNLDNIEKKIPEITNAKPEKSEPKNYTFDSSENSMMTKPDVDKKKKVAIVKVEEDSLTTINENLEMLPPFVKHKERYQYVFKQLTENGNISPERIIQIFTSKRAKIKDMAPIKIMSKKVITNTRLRSKKQTKQIARKIKKHLKKYKKYYNELEERFDVNKEIAAALFYKETVLGEFKNWKHESFTVLNTILGYMELPDKTEPRQRKRMQRIIESSQQSLAELLLYCEKYNIDILKKKFPSSFAGAIGIPQFLPMYLKYAISDDDNTKPDISKIHDAILSLGNILTTKFDWPGYIDMKQLKNIDEIRKRYKSYDDKYNNVSLCMSRDLDDYELLSFYDNFRDIPDIDYVCKYSKCLMKYNFSSSYSLDILQFAYYTYKEN